MPKVEVLISVSPKREVIPELRKHDRDTGSAPVQIGLLSARIEELTEHLKIHKKDNHSRYGLLKMVGRRRRLLKYLQGEDPQMYRTVISKLGIRVRR